jgi:hypothetical protein
MNIEDLAHELRSIIDIDADFISIISITANPTAIYAGWLVDDESFLELLPSAINLTYDDYAPPAHKEIGA